MLASGGGSNLQSLIDHERALKRSSASHIVLVASDRSDAGALGRGIEAGIPTATITSPRSPLGHNLQHLLSRHHIDLVVLAGYLQLVPPPVTRAFAGRMINVHPAPLPSFGGPGMYGIRVHRAVRAAHVPMSGPTVHFVDAEYDHGPTIAHWPVPVAADDDEYLLQGRVLRAEHLLYPRVVQAVAAGRVTLGADGTVTSPFLTPNAILPPFDPAHDTATLATLLDQAFAKPR